MLKRVLIALAALILIFVGVVALQPSEFHVERSATIAAPQDKVFAQVNDFRKWDAWSPWAKLDPQAKIAFEGPPSGEGTVMTWSGNDKVGEGKMTLDESRPDDLVKIKVDFVKPYEGKTMSQFTLKPEGDQTSVTWAMYARHNFFEKAFCLIMNGKKMVGDDMEKGLSQMKSVAESGS